MKLSVIIPIYTVDETLTQYLDYITNKVIKDIELILINTRSQYENIGVLERYEKKHHNLKIINEISMSIEKGKNIGISKAKGEYIVFLDNKEYIDYDTLKSFYEEALKYDLDILLFKSYKTKEVENKILFPYEETDIVYGEDIFNLMIEKKYENWPNYFNYLFKKEFIENNKLYFNENIYKIESILKANKVKILSNFNNNYKAILNDNDLELNNYKYSDFSYLCTNKIQEIFSKYKFKNSQTKLNLLRYINNIYTNELNDCDLKLDLENRRKICNSINKYKKNIDLSMQIDNPKLYYSMILNKRNLFIVHTPYHILLAISIINMEKYKNYFNEIIINNYFNMKSSEILKIKKIFDKVYILNREDVMDLAKINDIIGTNLYKNIFVNNESEIHTQFILNTRLRLNGNIIYIEDGSACYYDPNNNIKNGIGKNLAKTLSEKLNIDIQDIDHFGTYTHINERYFIYPKHIKPILNDGTQNKEINSDLIKRSIDILWKEKLDIIDASDKQKILILAEHIDHFKCNTDYSKEQYINLINYIIEESNKKSFEIYIKYHPRDDSFYLQDILKDYDNIKYLEKSIPVEVFYKVEKLKIIGLKSTAILTFSKTLGPKNIICLNNLLTYNKDGFIELIEDKIGVNCPNTTNELALKLGLK